MAETATTSLDPKRMQERLSPVVEPDEVGSHAPMPPARTGLTAEAIGVLAHRNCRCHLRVPFTTLDAALARAPDEVLSDCDA